MADVVASPLEKLLTVRQQHMAMGKEFNELVWRREINRQYRERGWPEERLLEEVVPNPEYIPPSAEYARRVRMDEREARAEMDAERAKTQAQLTEQSDAVAMARAKDERIRELEAQIRGLTGQTDAPPPPSPAPASVTPGPSLVGVPTMDWTMVQIRQFAAENNLAVPAPSFGETKVALLEAVMAAYNAQQDGGGDELPS